MSYVLGATGAGKSTIVKPLRAMLPGWIVLDWDALIVPASALARTNISQTPETWEPYEHLVLAVVEQILPSDVVVLGVCTPQQLSGWPIDMWLLLDCTDEERRTRLAGRHDSSHTADALRDAAFYRSLGLPVVESTGLTPKQAAAAVAEMCHVP
jgi:hypothetical protein